jgi:anti-anti-sigma factor
MRVEPLCTVETSRAGDATVACLRGEIDLSNAHDVEDQLAAAARGATNFVVDLSDLDYIDSSGFGMLERLMQATPLRIVVPAGAVIRRAFAVTGLQSVVPTFETVGDAVRAD